MIEFGFSRAAETFFFANTSDGLSANGDQRNKCDRTEKTLSPLDTYR